MAERGRKLRGRSPLLRLVGLGLIAIPGFGLGLLAGVAWEEPKLLAGHLFGRSEEVAWGAPGQGGGADGEEPEAASTQRLPPVAAAVPTERATRLRPEVLSPGAAAARFAVQVGAFSESRSAERLAASLRRKGFAVYVSPGAKAGEARWRVRVGPIASREEAERTASRLKAEEKLPTWVLDEDGAL